MSASTTPGFRSTPELDQCLWTQVEHMPCARPTSAALYLKIWILSPIQHTSVLDWSSNSMQDHTCRPSSKPIPIASDSRLVLGSKTQVQVHSKVSSFRAALIYPRTKDPGTRTIHLASLCDTYTQCPPQCWSILLDSRLWTAPTDPIPRSTLLNQE